jgi:hypothetical protein
MPLCHHAPCQIRQAVSLQCTCACMLVAEAAQPQNTTPTQSTYPVYGVLLVGLHQFCISFIINPVHS